MIDFVKRERAALARFQIFVEHPIAADVEIPHGMRHWLENLRLVDRDRLFLGRIAHSLDGVIALAVIAGQFFPRQLAQQVRLDQRPAEDRQSFEIVSRFRKRNARKIDAQKLRVFRAVGWRVQDGVDVAEDFFGRIVMLVAGIDESAEGGGEILLTNVSFSEMP